MEYGCGETMIDGQPCNRECLCSDCIEKLIRSHQKLEAIAEEMAHEIRQEVGIMSYPLAKYHTYKSEHKSTSS